MEKKNIFEQGSIRKTYFSLAIPVTLGMVFTVIYNVADTYFIAQTQNTDLVAAVSLCGPVLTLLMAFGNIFGQGGTSLISRLYGKGDLEGTKRVSAFCFYASLVTGAVLGLTMILFHDPFLKLLGANEVTYGYALPYFLTLTAGGPLVVANYVYMNLLRAEGMSKESTIGNVSGLLINIVLDPIFISVLGWGAFGAALATMIGMTFSNLFYLLMVLKKSKILSANPRLVRLSRKDAGQIFGIGVSAALTNVMSSLAMVLINQFLLPYGTDQIAAMGIAQKVGMIVLLVLVGMSFGSAPIVGYCYGGGQYDRLKALLRFLARTIGGTAVVLTTALFLLAGPLVSAFLKDEAVISAATLMLRCQISTMILAAAIMLITICFQASGKATEALVVSILRQGVVFFLVIAAASRLAGYTGVLAAQPVADAISAVIAGALFWKKFYRPLGEGEKTA